MILNKITNSSNSLKTAIKNGILTNPQNFIFYKIINKDTKRFITHTNANRLIKENKATLSNFIIPPNFISYKKIYINNKANQTIVKDLKNIEFFKQQQAKRKNVILELKQKQKKIVYKVKAKDSIEGGGYFTIYNIVKRLGIDGEIKVIFKPNTPQEQTRFYNIDGRQLYKIFKYDAELQIDIEDVLNNEEIIIEKISNDELTTTYTNQEFLDTPTENYHCLLSPIREHFQNLKVRTKTKNYIEIIDNYIKKYSSGIPENDIQIICDTLNISIEIYDLFNRKTLKFYSKNSRNTFSFINQRFNHVELLNNYSLDTKNAKLISKDQLKIKYDELLKKGENPLYKTNYNDELTAIFSANEGVYYLDEPFKIARDNFNKSIGLNQVKFSTDDENIFNFLKTASRTTTHQLFHPIYDYDYIEGIVNVIYDMKEYKEYDLKKAYSQFKNNKYYLGFPSKLTNFQLINQNATKEFLSENIGYFFIDTIDYSNLTENTLRFFKALGISSGIYSTPELLLFLEHNLKFNLSYGLWSIVPFHFEFSHEMLETGFYKKWTGELNMFNKSIKYYQKRLPKQEKFLGHLLNSYPEEISVFSDTIIFSKPFKNFKTFGHIGGFITAYTRTTMITELLSHNFNDILALKLDSFICKKNITPNNSLFVEKPVRVLNKRGFPFMNTSPIYSHFYSLNPPTSQYDKRFSNRILCLNGQGGSGKTHYVLTNEGIIDKLFSAVPWRLCVEKQKEFNIKAVSFACLSGKEFIVNDKLRKSICYSEDKEINPSLHTPANIIIDEMTMLSNDDINKVISTYPYSRIWFIGDVSSKGKAFQTTFQNNYFNLSKMKLITFSNDYRSKCDKLKQLKLKLREFRELEIPEEEQLLQIYKFIKSNFTIQKLEDIKSIYNVNDWILCSTKEGDKSRAKIINNIIDGEKYRIISHSKKDVFNRLNGNTEYLLNGDWIIGTKPNIPESRFEKTNASTIHSVQGLTVEEENKIFIDLNKLFDVNLIYTAISRARNLNQLYFFR